MSFVVKPNATVKLYNQDKSSLLHNDMVGNLQRDTRDAATVIAILQGRGRSPSDFPHLFRVRVDVFQDGTAPVVNDTVFIAWHKTNPTLVGWYTVWDEPLQTAGNLPTQVLYIRKEIPGL